MQIAQVVVKQIFTYGTMADSSTLLLQIEKTPEIRELHLHSLNDGQPAYQPASYWKSIQAVVENLQHYLSTILKTKGARHTVAERAFRTVVAACCGSNLSEKRIGRATARLLVIEFVIILCV